MSEPITFAQWRRRRVERFVKLVSVTPENDRIDYMLVQAESLVNDALHFSRTGLRDDDPMPGL